MAQSASVGAFAPVLTVIDGIPTTTSNEVAQHFGKQHDDVLRRVRALIADAPTDFTARNFAASEYIDSTGRSLPAFRLTRDGFTLLAMGFTGKRALMFKLGYIAEFNRMEAALRQSTPAPTQDELLHQAQVNIKGVIAAQASSRVAQLVMFRLFESYFTEPGATHDKRWLLDFDGAHPRLTEIPVVPTSGPSLVTASGGELAALLSTFNKDRSTR